MRRETGGESSRKGHAMQLRIGIVICSLAVAGVTLGGCATGGGSGLNWSSGSQCEARAKTQQDRNECGWKRAEAHGN